MVRSHRVVEVGRGHGRAGQDRRAARTRVLLLSLDWLRAKDPRVSLAQASLLARLRQEDGVEVESLGRAVNAPGFDRDALLEAVWGRLGRDTTLAIGVYVWNDALVCWLLAALRRRGFAGRIVLGGPQISYAPVGIAGRYPQADALIRGYGEDALAAVLGCPVGAPIPGVCWQGGPDLGRPAPVDLGCLPSPILTGELAIQPFMRWETQRGCIYRCRFCQHREAGARLARRTLPAARVHAEVDALVAGGARDIAVLDPIFNASRDAVGVLRRFADRAYCGRLSVQARFELLDDVFLDACQGLDIRLEFGLQTVHEVEMRAVGRVNHLDRVEAAISSLLRRRLHFEVSLIYGLPHQTLESFRQTLRWCQDRGVPVIRAYPLMLLRGTTLEQQREQWRLVESDDRVPVVVESDSFSRADWEKMRALAAELCEDRAGRGAA